MELKTRSPKGERCGRYRHDGDTNRFVGTGLSAGGSLADGEALRAHVAFADDAAFLRVLGNFVGALEHAILAADALVIEMANDARDCILLVGQDGAAVQAARVGAMMASGGDSLREGLPPVVADQAADVTPGFAFVEAVE